MGIAPVVLFLAGLRLLDSFKLVARRDVLGSIGFGMGTAAAAFVVNTLATRLLPISPDVLRHWIAPLLEECLKAAGIVLLVRAARVGFLVDAAIHGFAIGTGFAVVENVFYAWLLGTFDPALWIVRGLGTALLHGSTTAIVGILCRHLLNRRPGAFARATAPGLAIAFVAHAIYNRLLLDPVLATLLQLVFMPLLLIVVFERSERATQQWLGKGFDGDVERLDQILEGEVRESPIGRYLETLRQHFAPTVLADMLCMVRIHLELALRAKGLLIARSAGIELPPDPAVRANFEELGYLERSVGAVGRMAIQPLLGGGDRERWQLHQLRQSVAPGNERG